MKKSKKLTDFFKTLEYSLIKFNDIEVAISQLKALIMGSSVKKLKKNQKYKSSIFLKSLEQCLINFNDLEAFIKTLVMH